MDTGGNGGTVITRYVLEDLLNKLDELHVPGAAENSRPAACTAREASGDERSEPGRRAAPGKAPGCRVRCCAHTLQPAPAPWRPLYFAVCLVFSEGPG
jgi:hypothetical protein